MPPLNLVGDFGGGSLFLGMGLLAGVLAARASGVGQVVDVSMVEGSASHLAGVLGLGVLRADGLGHRRGAAGAGFVEVFVVEQHRLQALAHVPLDVVGQHAQEATRPTPLQEKAFALLALNPGCTQ